MSELIALFIGFLLIGAFFGVLYTFWYFRKYVAYIFLVLFFLFIAILILPSVSSF